MQYYNLYKLQYISIINYINHNLVVNHYSKINPSPASTGSDPDQDQIRPSSASDQTATAQASH